MRKTTSIGVAAAILLVVVAVTSVAGQRGGGQRADSGDDQREHHADHETPPRRIEGGPDRSLEQVPAGGVKPVFEDLAYGREGAAADAGPADDLADG